MAIKDTFSHFVLKILRRIYRAFIKNIDILKQGALLDPDLANDTIYELLASGKPCMIARYGFNELLIVSNYLGIQRGKHICAFISGKQAQWWWNENIVQQMRDCAGFYPVTSEALALFSELMLRDSKELDLLGSWLPHEKTLQGIIPNIPRVLLPFLEPFHGSRPWTRYLEGKRVVVIHPFAKSIISQYAHRKKIFDNSHILPDFESIRIVKAVQSIGGGEFSI